MNNDVRSRFFYVCMCKVIFRNICITKKKKSMKEQIQEAAEKALREWIVNLKKLKIEGTSEDVVPDPKTSRIINILEITGMNEDSTDKQLFYVTARTEVWILVKESQNDKMTQECRIEANVRVAYVNFKYVAEIEKINCFAIH